MEVNAYKDGENVENSLFIYEKLYSLGDYIKSEEVSSKKPNY